MEVPPFTMRGPTWHLEDVAFGKQLTASQDLESRVKVHSFKGSVCLDKPTLYTVQLRAGQHDCPSGGSEFTNHSCDPNCRVVFEDDADFKFGDLVTLRPVRAGEALTFNYVTTEWDMSSPFDCVCGSEKCLGRIAGFRYLAYEQRTAIQHLCSPYINTKLNVDVA